MPWAVYNTCAEDESTGSCALYYNYCCRQSKIDQLNPKVPMQY
jgi:hypothetical protein